MKTPVVLVAAALTAAILLAASILIATGTRGDNALQPLFGKPVGASLRLAPAADDDAAPRTGAFAPMESERSVHLYILTRFLPANRYPPRIECGAGFCWKTLEFDII
jgi:hypothetical protein